MRIKHRDRLILKLDLKVASLAIELSEGGGESPNKRYLRRGFLRRQLMIRQAAHALHALSSGGRTVPLFPFEAVRATAQLNWLYLNIRGANDNLAWALKARFNLLPAVSESNPNGRGKVDLFADAFLKELSPALPALARRLRRWGKYWATDFRERRDPAAHRLPLYVAPGVVTDEEILRSLQNVAVRIDDTPAENSLPLSEWSARARAASEFVPCFVVESEAGHVVYRLKEQLDWDLLRYYRCADAVLIALGKAGVTQSQG